MLRRPKNSYELSLITKNDLDKLQKKEKIEIQLGNFILIKNLKTIYILQNSDFRSALVHGTSLRNLSIICEKYDIPELIVIKNKENAQLLNDIKENIKEIKKQDFKICIINDIKKITDILLTGGHAGINRMYNNIKKNIIFGPIYIRMLKSL